MSSFITLAKCNAVVDVDSVDLFKSSLDNFSMFQDVNITLPTFPVQEIDLCVTVKVIEKL